MMAKPVLLDDAFWKMVEDNRLRDERLQEPYLVAFRATQEEIALRKAEDAKEAALPDETLLHWAEGIARAARESVRFQRYLVRQGFYPNIPKDAAPRAGLTHSGGCKAGRIGDLPRYMKERPHPFS